MNDVQEKRIKKRKKERREKRLKSSMRSEHKERPATTDKLVVIHCAPWRYNKPQRKKGLVHGPEQTGEEPEANAPAALVEAKGSRHTESQRGAELKRQYEIACAAHHPTIL